MLLYNVAARNSEGCTKQCYQIGLHWTFQYLKCPVFAEVDECSSFHKMEVLLLPMQKVCQQKKFCHKKMLTTQNQNLLAKLQFLTVQKIWRETLRY